MKNTPSLTAASCYFWLAMAQIMVAINIVGSKYLVQSYSLFFLLATRFFIATAFLILAHYGRKLYAEKKEKQRIKNIAG